MLKTELSIETIGEPNIQALSESEQHIIPQENFKRKRFNRKRSKTTTTTIGDQTKQKFETAYAESQSLPKRHYFGIPRLELRKEVAINAE